MITVVIRKKVKTVLFSLAVVLGCCFFKTSNQQATPDVYNIYIKNHTDVIIFTLQNSIKLAEAKHDPLLFKQLQSHYFLVRKHYKQIECVIEYCAPFDTKYFINGALVKKSELEIGKRVVDPHGLQVIEEQLFGVDSLNKSLLLSELNLLLSAFKTFEKKRADFILNDSQFIEMIQLS